MSHDLRQQRRPVRAARRVSPLKVTLAVVASIVAVIVLFGAGIAAEQYHRGLPSAATAATSAPVKAVVTGPGLGDPVRDGKLEFVVSRLDCSHTTIGIEHLKRTAQGRFCVVSMSVRNVGDRAKYFVGHVQKARDASGAEYRSDELAGVYANNSTKAFLDRLAPGDKVTGKLVFDVPAKTRLTVLELHDGLLSDGVEVHLS